MDIQHFSQCTCQQLMLTTGDSYHDRHIIQCPLSSLFKVVESNRIRVKGEVRRGEGTKEGGGREGRR